MFNANETAIGMYIAMGIDDVVAPLWLQVKQWTIYTSYIFYQLTLVYLVKMNDILAPSVAKRGTDIIISFLISSFRRGITFR